MTDNNANVELHDESDDVELQRERASKGSFHTERVDLDAELEKQIPGGLDPHTDPFAPREGKALVWTNVNMTLVCRIQDAVL